MSMGYSGSDRDIIQKKGDETIKAITDLNKATSFLSWVMIGLTVILVILTGVLVWLTIILISK